MIRTLLPAAFVASTLAIAPTAMAASTASPDSTAIDGTYLLIQANDSQRVLALKPGGSASLISQGQQVRGYTSGLGSWAMTGPDSARATVIDFNDPSDEADGNGASQLVFDLVFSDAVDGQFQNVSGHFSGQAFAKGQNPLAEDALPTRTFGTRFDGMRVGVS